jgi:hypothetical protein
MAAEFDLLFSHDRTSKLNGGGRSFKSEAENAGPPLLHVYGGVAAFG